MKKKIFLPIAAVFSLVVFVSCSGAPEVPGMVFIPDGEFVMGSDEKDAEALGVEFGVRSGKFYENESPVRKISLKGYYIDKYEVTNADFKKFYDSVRYGFEPGAWEVGKTTYPEGRGDHPVTGVTWEDASNYCAWAGKRLPAEEEWEKASRGPNGNRYPWGADFDAKKGNFTNGSLKPVGSFGTDKSHYGVYDMAGNASEWVHDWYRQYPGNKVTDKAYGEQYKVYRGADGASAGHYALPEIYARGAARRFYLPAGAGLATGFRCAKDYLK